MVIKRRTSAEVSKPSTIHLYVDANILVKFFEISSDSLAELEKLLPLIDSGDAILWLPEQTKREFWKRRDSSIHKDLAKFETSHMIEKPPLLVRSHPRFKALLGIVSKAETLRTTIVSSVREAVDNELTNADSLIRDLFHKAQVIDTDEPGIFEKAVRRAKCMLPPGKEDHLGDRLNWVALLDRVPKNASLHIISADSDYCSESSNDKVKRYLEKEWKNKNGGTLRLWIRPSQFLAAHFPDATSALDIERSILSRRLRESSSFAQTHSTIRALSNCTGFSEENLRFIVEALIENDQVYWIASDSDVRRFFKKLLRDYGSKIDASLLAEANKILG